MSEGKRPAGGEAQSGAVGQQYDFGVQTIPTLFWGNSKRNSTAKYWVGGKNSSCISVPKRDLAWIGCKAGSRVSIAANEGVLSIRPNARGNILYQSGGSVNRLTFSFPRESMGIGRPIGRGLVYHWIEGGRVWFDLTPYSGPGEHEGLSLAELILRKPLMGEGEEI